MDEMVDNLPYEGDTITDEWLERSAEFTGKQRDVWDAWANPREVRSWGICDNWELKEKK
jgi:hypothetical protein